MFTDIYAFEKNIHEAIIMTDCKNCGPHSGQNMRKSVFGQVLVQETHVKMKSGDRPNILRASRVNSKICTRAYLKYPTVRSIATSCFQLHKQAMRNIGVIISNGVAYLFRRTLRDDVIWHF